MTTRGPFEPEFLNTRRIPVFRCPAPVIAGRQIAVEYFEPRYLAMVRDCLIQPHRLIGMIQPRADEEDNLYILSQASAGSAIMANR